MISRLTEERDTECSSSDMTLKPQARILGNTTIVKRHLAKKSNLARRRLAVTALARLSKGRSSENDKQNNENNKAKFQPTLQKFEHQLPQESESVFSVGCTQLNRLFCR